MTGNLFSDGNMPTTPGENENIQVISGTACPLKVGRRPENNGEEALAYNFLGCTLQKRYRKKKNVYHMLPHVSSKKKLPFHILNTDHAMYLLQVSFQII